MKNLEEELKFIEDMEEFKKVFSAESRKKKEKEEDENISQHQ
jgi:hypothetical protein